MLTAAILSLPSLAHAQMAAQPTMASDTRLMVSPFAGATFGGDTATTGGTIGMSASFWVKPWIGVEADAAYTPMLFEQDGFLIDRSVTTLTGQVIVAPPMFTRGRLTPFVTAGLGLLRPNLAEAGALSVAKGNTLQMSIGAGAMGFFNDHVGLRGDVRYTRGLRESELDQNVFGVDFSRFSFWRTTGGLVVRF